MGRGGRILTLERMRSVSLVRWEEGRGLESWRGYTRFLVFIEANEAEIEVHHACVSEEGNSFSRAAQVRGGVVFRMSGQGICHGLQNALRAERIGRHGDVLIVLLQLCCCNTWC